MAKEIFKNLPDKSTPLSASKLNGLFDGAESMGSIVVEDIQCKNLFNVKAIPSTINQISGNGKITNNGDGTLTISDNTNNSGYTDTLVKLSSLFNGEVGKTYTFNFNSNFSVSGRNNRVYLLGANVSIYTNTPFTLTQEMLDSSVILYGGYNETTTMSNFQIEKGSVATDYVEHKEFSNKQIYSTSEQVIGTWIDGKPLYQKTFDFGVLPNNKTKEIYTGIAIDTLVELKGWTTNGTMCLLIPHADANSPTSNITTFGAKWSTSNVAISVKTGVDRSEYTTTYLTAKYTKTTD